MVQKPTEVIINELVRQIQATLPEANVQPGSVLREAFINTSASQISLLFNELDNVRIAQTISEATGVDLDRIAANFGLIRDTGRAAIGTATLILSENIVSTTININDGSVVSTDERTRIVDFRLIGSQTFRPVDADLFAAEAFRLRSSLTTVGITDAQFVSTVSIEAFASGTNGNVGTGTIIRGNLPGVRAIVNLAPTTGGTDVETDESLRRRISLVLSGSNTGTEEGLIAIARNNPSVTAVAVVRPGDPLMTRDGSVFDEDGNLVQAGTGRDVDVYLRGSLFVNRAESFVFTDNSNGASVSTANNLILGFDQATNTSDFGFQPISVVTDLVGSITGANFSAGQEVRDDEGNVTLDGNYILLKDKDADQFSLVQNNETGEIKVASFVNLASNNFTVLEQLQTSDNANSSLGRDAIFFLTNVATVEEEVVTRGTEFNGSDTLAFSDVAQIQAITEDVILTKESVVTEESENDSFTVFTKHSPIIEVINVRNARLGQDYSFEIIDTSTGQLRLIGRFPPQTGDIIQVTYTWRQERLQNIEYFLQGDTAKWSRPPHDKSTEDGLGLLDSTTLVSSLDLQIQPLTPTYLAMEATQLTARGRYTLTVNGDKARILENQTANFDASPDFATSDFVFQVPAPPSSTASRTRLGRLVAVRNLTQGYRYTIEDYALNTNVYDPAARVEASLEDNEFLLSAEANERQLEVGDKMLLSRRSLTKHWTTTEDFTNNIGSNPAPIFDLVTTRIENDEVTVRRHEDDDTTPVTTLAGSIASSGSLSGIVEIIDNVVIESGATVILEPNTVIKFRESSALDNQELATQIAEFNNVITAVDIATATDIEENIYIFQQPEGTTAPFFVILNDSGTATLTIFFVSNVVQQVVSERDGGGLPTVFDYSISGVPVPEEFIGTSTGSGLLAAITSQPATFLGYRRLELDDSITEVSATAIVDGRAQYSLLLTEQPVTSGIAQDDFSLFQTSSPEAVFTDINFSSERNILFIDGLAVEANYTLEYFTAIEVRLSLTVKGVLQTSTDITESTPVVFTSAADSPAPGDWEGIIFDPLSRRGAPGNPNIQSFLTNCIIKNARIAVRNDTSDPLIDGCIIRQCSELGYSVTSSFFTIEGFTRSDLRLLSNDFTESGRSYAEVRDFTDSYGYGYGYGDGYSYGPSAGSTRTLSFTLDNLLTTSEGVVPTFIKIGTQVQIEDTIDVDEFRSKYTVDFAPGLDFDVFVDNVRILPGVDADFAMEYDLRRGGFLLSFFNTTLTTSFLTDHVVDTNVITIDFFSVFNNGTISNTIFTGNGNTAVDIDKTSFVTLDNNTMHSNGFYGITVDDSYASLNNNIVTGFSTTPVLQSDTSVLAVKTNNLWSETIVLNEQTEIADTDRLLQAVDTINTILTIASPQSYQRGFIIKIEDEFMEVLNVLGDRVEVVRGENNTTPMEHAANTDIFIQRTRVIFSITGVPGEFCQIREVTSDGNFISGRVPVDMRKITDNTFRTAFTTDRTGTFFYRYQFKTELSEPTWTLTNTRRVFSFQFGSGVHNFLNANQEVDIVVGSEDSTNISDNPLYEQQNAENFRIPDNSPSSQNHPAYATPSDPSAQANRFIGRQSISQEESLVAGTLSATLQQTPIVVTSIQDDIVVQQVGNPDRTIPVGSYDDSTKVLTFAAPITSAQVGIYEVVYSTPITQGSLLNPFPLTTSLTYIFDEEQTVSFTRIEFGESGGAGNVKSRFRVANDTSELGATTFSDYTNESPFDLSSGTLVFPRGRVIEFEMVLETNDAGFTATGDPVFPKLLDISLFLTPARDDTLYKILALTFDNRDQVTLVTIEDDELQGSGIRSSTFAAVGADEALSIIARKAEDDFDSTKEFIIAEAEGITTGDTILRAKGDLTTTRTAPSPNDIVVADYILVDVDDSEVMVFVEQGTQITSDRFYRVTNVTSTVVVDGLPANFAGEQLTVNSTAQPSPGAQYLANYTFAAPTEGETITVTYNYDDVVRQVAQDVENQRVLTSDILTRAGFEVQTRIEASIFIDNGFNASAILIDIANAVGIFFASLPGFGGTIVAVDLKAVMESVTGVDRASLTVLSRTAENTVADVTLNNREYGALAPGAPILTIAATTDPNTTLATNSL